MNKVKISDWPVEDGRYKVGNTQSPIAVCTEATVEGINVDLKKVAIIGKCVTENIGIEKVVKNIISNPNIRFLILCGKKSHGHDVGQTLISLQKNGVDKEMKVVGSTGSIPVVKHLSFDEVHRFRDQVLPVDLQGEISENRISFEIEKYLKQDPGAFTGKPMKVKKLKEGELIKCVQATEDRKVILDQAGSLQIFIDPKEKLIILRHQNKKIELDVQINGKTGKAVYETALRMKLLTRMDHAAYLGEELAKAEIALKNGLDYVQDKELTISHVTSHISQVKEDEFGW